LGKVQAGVKIQERVKSRRSGNQKRKRSGGGRKETVDSPSKRDRIAGGDDGVKNIETPSESKLATRGPKKSA